MSVEVGILVCGNIAFRPGYFENVGDRCDGHKHNFDHPTIVTAGGIQVQLLDDDDNVQEAHDVYAEALRNFINIAKGRRHRLVALLPRSRYLCAYPHRNEDGEIVEYYTGWEPAYS
jgi:hypothetical protein